MVFGHSKRLRELAAGHGWTWQKHDPALVDAFVGQPFGIGRFRRTDNVMRGWFQGRQVLVCETVFRTGSGDDERTCWFGVFCVTDLPLALPVLEVVRRGWTKPPPSHGIGSRYRTGHPGFDRAYRVTAQQPAEAARVLTPAFVGFLLSRPALDWRIEGTRLLAWSAGTVRVKQMEDRLATLVELAAAIPREVWWR